MVKITCPVCYGTGKVDSDFGGGCPGGAKKQCPACCGTGMQEVSDYEYRKRCPERYIPWNPCPQPYYPWVTPVWYSTTGSTTAAVPTQTTSVTYTGSYSCFL